MQSKNYDRNSSKIMFLFWQRTYYRARSLKVYQISMSSRYRNVLDSSGDSESDHEPQFKQSRPTGTIEDG